ncbi:MAG: FAD-dependent oxidoreductase [Rhizobiaceae bacterium]|nr:FAD-dependent oxidoreductase [Rhizobiaceae bacterium]MCV0404896.1 FAD-dependent oxidoreductase [Rhizobiaceae bacterium]
MSEFDVIVVGSGVGGMTAAIVAARLDMSVLVVEKTDVFGGTTAYSGGVAWIPNNHHMKEAGVEDSREEAEIYLRATLGNHYDAAKIEAFLDNGPEMLRFLEANSELDFVAVPTPDYLPWNPGSKHHRGVLAREFDGTKLGERLNQLRQPLDVLTVFSSMQVAGADIVPLRKAFRTFSGFVHTTRMVTRYARQKLMHGRGTRLVSGNALAGRLFKSALDAGVTLWRNTAAHEVLVEDSRVVGLVVNRDGANMSLVAERAVVLASGGFGANAEMREKFMPLAEHHVSLQPAGNVGDGIAMGVAAGAQLVENNPANGIFTPVSMIRDADGTERKFPHIMIDRYMPGSIAVDPSGRRFVNEADSYQNFVMTMQQKGLSKVHMIADRAFLRRYGMGLARPFPYPVRPWVRNGYLIEAASIRELGERIGVDGNTLAATVARFNEHAAKGEDPDFKRGDDAHSRFRGDAENQPNPSLAPIVKPPFYAIALLPGDLSSVAGLRTDERARVLRADGSAFEGLYAVGLDMNSMTSGLYPAGGSSLGPGLTFGYIAARDIAASVSAKRDAGAPAS